MFNLSDIENEAFEAASELCSVAGVGAGGVMIVGCSSSEIAGGKIGTASSPEIAEAVYAGLTRALAPRGIFLAAQCCEHLNRAVVVERQAVPGAYYVNAVPQPKAGGSFAATAYRRFSDPIVLEGIAADMGLDIGGTLIGMHLKPVAVPVRLSRKSVGEAVLLAARTRPKFIGGVRAVYDENLL